MSEMLGNQYFMARKYSEAEEVFLECLRKDTDNVLIKKKLIICFTQTGQIENALRLFEQFVDSNIDIILSTNPVIDDCPCPELVYDLEKNINSVEEINSKELILGILWLYCNIEKSIKYFDDAVKLMPGNEIILRILNKLKIHFSTLQEKVDIKQPE